MITHFSRIFVGFIHVARLKVILSFSSLNFLEFLLDVLVAIFNLLVIDQRRQAKIVYPAFLQDVAQPVRIQVRSSSVAAPENMDNFLHEEVAGLFVYIQQVFSHYFVDNLCKNVRDNQKLIDQFVTKAKNVQFLLQVTNFGENVVNLLSSPVFSGENVKTSSMVS